MLGYCIPTIWGLREHTFCRMHNAKFFSKDPHWLVSFLTSADVVPTKDTPLPPVDQRKFRGKGLVVLKVQIQDWVIPFLFSLYFLLDTWPKVSDCELSLWVFMFGVWTGPDLLIPLSFRQITLTVVISIWSETINHLNIRYCLKWFDTM